jgi:acetoin utilization deacetylase AcuC-like enzyme
MSARAAVVCSPEYACDIGSHVFPIEKYRGVREALIASGHVAEEDFLEPSAAPRDDLLLVHTAEYLDDLYALRWTARTRTSELPLSAAIVRAYVLAAGGTTLAARAAMADGIGVHIGGGFHHAFADLAAGFCYINDLAVAARVLQRDGVITRVAVVDCDVHQGNGTARIFQNDSSVFTFSIHQEHLYPIKERGDLDVGLDNGAGDDAFNRPLAAALEQVWAHAPDLVLYQAGADPFEDDQLGGLKLTHAGLAARDRLVLEGCATRGLPVVVTLGGGYARRLEDTVRIHATTCRVALELAAARDVQRAGA